jgi:hypothetical protein
MTKARGPFDVIQDMCSLKIYEYTPETDQLLNAFLTNRSMSNNYDTIMLANEMNTMAVSKCPKRWIYDFYFHAITVKKKRYSPWAKPKSDNKIKVIMESYKCSQIVAQQYCSILSDSDIIELEERMSKGGR